MSKTLTRAGREDKADVDLGRHVQADNPTKRCFPSYFDDFCAFSRFLMFQMNAACNKRVVPYKTKFPLAAAFMAIV